MSEKNSPVLNVSQEKMAAVIGSPVTHSLSPALFRWLARHQKILLDYQAVEVTALQLPNFLRDLREKKDFVGVNVTLPLKEIALEGLDEVSEEGRMIGAINVIQVKQNRLFGFNSDVIGIQKTISSKKFKAKNQNCLVWGAGGSAKAVLFVLGKLQVKNIYIYNPRSARGTEIALAFQNQFPETRFSAIHSLSEVAHLDLGLVVNTTPVGMKRVVEKQEDPHFFKGLAELSFSESALAFDLIYTPENTQFLMTARNLGLNAIGGLSMLIDQALATWELWFGPLEQEEAIRKSLLTYLRGLLNLREDASPVFITGFMGVGKSTVGAELASLCGRMFIDTDQWIEKLEEHSVQSIFQNKGEAYFRKLEKAVVKEVSKMKSVIVALGGGAILDGENLSAVKETGTLVCLLADEKTLDERIATQGFDRPLLSGLGLLDRQRRIATLLQERGALYEQAHLSVSTLKRTPHEVAQAILSQIGLRK